jgi:hypothetical protein
MKHTLPITFISWKSAWQALLLRSALTALLLAPLVPLALQAAETNTPPGDRNLPINQIDPVSGFFSGMAERSVLVPGNTAKLQGGK